MREEMGRSKRQPEPKLEAAGPVLVLALVAAMVGSTLAEAYGIIPIPRWVPVVLLPSLIGGLIWFLGGATASAILSWIAPLVMLLSLGYFVLPDPLGSLVLSAALVWAILMVLSTRVIALWYRVVLRRSR